MSAGYFVTLNDGNLQPLIGFGTYKIGFVPATATSAGGIPVNTSDSSTTKRVFLDALDVGYRFFDCAQFYNNEDLVGEALKESGIPRDQLFLASKVWTDKIYAGEEAIREQLNKTLKDLQTDYLDLYLLHWPVPTKHVEAYKVLEHLKKEGKIKSIGVSNYTIEDYKELKPHITIQPTVNQIEVNPFLYRKNTIGFFQKEGVVIQSYRSLRQGQVDNVVVSKIAEKYGKSPAQVFGRWCTQKGIVFLPKTVSKGRMIENMNIFDFELTTEDQSQLESLTTPQNLEAFKLLYEKCVIRDTPLKEGVKTNITID